MNIKKLLYFVAFVVDMESFKLFNLPKKLFKGFYLFDFISAFNNNKLTAVLGQGNLGGKLANFRVQCVVSEGLVNEWFLKLLML